MTMTDKQEALNRQSTWDFSDLRAMFINCTLKRSPELSHTEGLARISMEIMRRNGVEVELVRAVDHEIPVGVYPDMTEHGWDRDDWPAIFERVMASDILVLCSSIWLGEKSSVCTKVVERLYGNSHILNEAGQYAYYGRVGGCLITGNEDGVKHCAMNILYSLQHLGYVIPPQADAGWIGEAGPGPSYLDPGSGGPENDFTNRNTTFMTWNLMHLARMLKDRGGIPAHGNQRSEWDAGCRFDFEASPSARVTRSRRLGACRCRPPTRRARRRPGSGPGSRNGRRRPR
jgi:multimeric flavodoxin WrbA